LIFTDAGERKRAGFLDFDNKMSDDGWKPSDGHGPDFEGSPSSSSRSVPIYVLFLIMLGSGIFTLVFLWICVQCIYHKRRVRRARADIERNAASVAAAQQAWETGDPAEGTEAKTGKRT